jgi:type II secretory pathway pseudopilin PulG
MRKQGERGFAMLVVFLMAASIAIALYVELPRVAFESQRNREELLVARGEAYKRGVELYYRKLKTYPQKMEDLENTNNFRFLRKRYKDPLTGKDEWRLLHMGPAGLTDSLVEKMPGLDPNGKDKDKKDGTQVASNAGGPVDPNAPKSPDDVTADAARKARDERALLAQRGGGGGGGSGPTDPNMDPEVQRQQQLIRDFERQQQQQQQGQGQPSLDPNPANPGAPPSSVTVTPGGGGVPPSAFPGQNPPPGFPQQGFPQQGFPQQPGGFPPIGSQGGPVRTLYPTGGGSPPPFNPGNAMIRGAIPNPSGTVANSQTGGGFPGSTPRLPGGPQNQALSDINRMLTTPRTGSAFATPQGNQFGGGGIAGVASNATGSGIKRYNERSKYKEWEFVFDYRKPAKGAQKGVTGIGAVPGGPGTGAGTGFGNPAGGGGTPGFGGSGGRQPSSGFSGGAGSSPRR